MKDNGKILLEAFGEKEDQLAAYRRYLGKTVFSNANHTQLAALPDKLLRNFYHLADPTQPPAFFDFREPGDVTVLETALNCNIVIFRWLTDCQPFRLHDTRVLRQLRSVLCTRPTRYFLIAPGETVLRECASEDCSGDPDRRFRQNQRRVKLEGCLPALFDLLLREEEGEVSPHSGPVACVHEAGTSWCSDLMEVVRNRDEVMSTVSRHFLLATHIRTRFYRTPRHPGAQHFANLSFFFPSGEMPHDADSCPTLCLEREGYVYRLKPAYVPALVAKFGAPSKSAAGATQLKTPRPSLAVNPPPPRLAAAAEPAKGGGCDCDACLESPDYELNMKKSGPSLLYSTPLPLMDLLRLVGKDTPENRHVLLECSLYSLAAYDVESSATLVDGKAGNEDRHFALAGSISASHSGSELLNVQMPQMIGLADRLQLERDNGRPIVLRDFLYSDETTEPPDMIGSFLTHLRAMRLASVKRKRKLLGDLIAWAERYRSAHVKFYEDSGYVDEETSRECSRQHQLNEETTESARRHDVDPEKARARVVRKIELAFMNTYPFGKIWKRLDDLAERYLVAGFNSERFDLPLLSTRLVTELKSTSAAAKVKMNRQGSAVLSLSCDKITFVEIKRLLPPGTSLSGFGKMMNLEVSKDIFPFEKFVDASFLDQPELPADAADWFSQLSGTGPSQAAVDAARAEYAAAGYRHVGEWLTAYLEKDVLILLRGSGLLLEAFVDQLDLDFVEANKLTVSSLANAAGQLYLFRQLKPGFTRPNDSLIYSLLRKGLRGGLTVSQRSFGGCEVDPVPYADLARELDPLLSAEEAMRLATGINAHLFSETTDSAAVVHCLDVNSLYPSAGKSPLPPLLLLLLLLLCSVVVALWSM